jgi:hypothetical protein
LAIADALRVNASVTKINFDEVDAENASEFGNALIASALADALSARNQRFRHLFLFDARQMLLSAMCTDWCGIVWPYLLEADDAEVGVSSDNVEKLHAEFASIVEERRRRDVAAALFNEDGSRSAKRNDETMIDFCRLLVLLKVCCL